MRPADSVAASAAARAFPLPHEPNQPRPFGRGLINSTWSFRAGNRRYLLQALNPDVFDEPTDVMANIRRVTAHLRGKRMRCLELLPTRAGGDFHRDDDGRCWRLYPFIDGVSLPASDIDDARAHDAARLFGEFAAGLIDLPAPPLATTIAGFHDTPARLAALENALTQDACNRAGECRRDVEGLLAREGLAQALVRLGLPVRAVHNDTKLDNVLFDRHDGTALCVVDLDTVMPGLVAHDFGDLVRSACQRGFDVARYRALHAGYLAGIGATLTTDEVTALALGPGVITLELAARFLTDHLTGDCYFRTDTPGQNLQRARVQLALLGQLDAALGRSRPDQHSGSV